MNTRSVWIACLLAWPLGPGCSQTTTLEGDCRRSTDCEAYQRCDTLNYRCVCATDEACAQGEYCNPSGSCQVKAKCLSNADCESGSFCETGSGECVGVGTCTRDVHCDLGRICQAGVCRLGCRTTADCELMLREVCLEGACVSGRCENNEYCPFGQVCELADHACLTPAEPFCVSGCSFICAGCTDKTQGPCGHPANICSGQNPTYCLVACRTQAECPSGYDCVSTIDPQGRTCAEDVDCASVENVCGTASHRCALNKQPCDTDPDCHDFGPAVCLSGYCVIGQHCAPPGGCR
jgi:hypothetical protein